MLRFNSWGRQVYPRIGCNETLNLLVSDRQTGAKSPSKIRHQEDRQPYTVFRGNEKSPVLRYVLYT